MTNAQDTKLIRYIRRGEAVVTKCGFLVTATLIRENGKVVGSQRDIQRTSGDYVLDESKFVPCKELDVVIQDAEDYLDKIFLKDGFEKETDYVQD